MVEKKSYFSSKTGSKLKATNLFIIALQKGDFSLLSITYCEILSNSLIFSPSIVATDKDFMLIAKTYNLCIDCNKPHLPFSIYRIKNKIWKKYVGDFDARLLCKIYLSKRIERKLKDSDYTKKKY